MKNLVKNNSYEDLSRLFIYYNARALTGSEHEDNGAYLRDTLISASKYGVCIENLWPYNISKFTIEPSNDAYQDASHRKILNYKNVASVADMLDALNNNIPVIFGITVYKNEFSNLLGPNSILSIPLDMYSESGGHAMCAVGYDNIKKLILVKNSFGTEWGDYGYCWIPYDYMESQSYDMWVFEI